MKGRLRRLLASTFFMNAFYLMLSMFVVGALGFVFWILVTRSYPTATVGIAATLLSVSGLLSMLSLAGFDTVFVRYLPKSTRGNDYINSGMIIVGIISGVLSTCFVMSLPFTAPSLAFVLHNPWYFAGFVFFTIATSLNIVINAIFLARKRARDIFVINLFFSALKVTIPLVVVGGDALTIFAIVGFCQLIGLSFGTIVMKLKLGYVFSPKIHLDILRDTRKYSFSVYLSSILNLLPPTLLPLIVVHQLGPEDAAYYYVVFTIANALYTVAYASTQSAFAEGSHQEAAMKEYIIKAAKLIGVLLLPAALAIALLGDFILRIFGHEYAVGGNALLQLFALSAFTVALNCMLGAIFKVTHNLRGEVVTNLVYATVILGLSVALIPHYGLIAVGWAWLVGTTTSAVIGLIYAKRGNKNYQLKEV